MLKYNCIYYKIVLLFTTIVSSNSIYELQYNNDIYYG